MKRFILSAAVAVMVLGSSSGFAATLEAVVVKKVTVFANLMPPVEPDTRITAVVVADVLSGGCTDASSFQATLVNNRNSQALTLTRVKEDGCEAVLSRKEIELRVSGYELGKPLQVKNPLIVKEQVVY